MELSGWEEEDRGMKKETEEGLAVVKVEESRLYQKEDLTKNVNSTRRVRPYPARIED